MPESLETDVLARLISEKRTLLEKIRELARRQFDVIAGGEISRLLNVLGAKQTLLEQLQGTERQLDPFRDQDPESRQWRSPGERTRCRADAQRCESLLGEIMLIERQCETDLQTRRDDAAQRLSGAHCAAAARSAYVAASPARPAQLDITSDR